MLVDTIKKNIFSVLAIQKAKVQEKYREKKNGSNGYVWDIQVGKGGGWKAYPRAGLGLLK